jgi:hypothetical protein
MAFDTLYQAASCLIDVALRMALYCGRSMDAHGQDEAQLRKCYPEIHGSSSWKIVNSHIALMLLEEAAIRKLSPLLQHERKLSR